MYYSASPKRHNDIRYTISADWKMVALNRPLNKSEAKRTFESLKLWTKRGWQARSYKNPAFYTGSGDRRGISLGKYLDRDEK